MTEDILAENEILKKKWEQLVDDIANLEFQQLPNYGVPTYRAEDVRQAIIKNMPDYMKRG